MPIVDDRYAASPFWGKRRAWDHSVRQAVAQTKAVGRPPPKGFPEQVVVRFEVQVEADAFTP